MQIENRTVLDYSDQASILEGLQKMKMSSGSEKDNQEPISVRQSRDSKWLLPCVTGSVDGHVTRRNVARKCLTVSAAANSKSNKKSARITRKFPSKISLKSQAGSKNKLKASTVLKGNKSPDGTNQRKRKLIDQSDNSAELGNTKSKKRRTDNDLVAEKKPGTKNRKSDKAEKKLLTKPGKGGKHAVEKKKGRQTKDNKNALEKQKIKGESVEVSETDREKDLDDKVDHCDSDNTAQVSSKKQAKKSVIKKKKTNSSVQNGIPSIEDELKIIEGGVQNNKLSGSDNTTHNRKSKRIRKQASLKNPNKKALLLTRHCNFCPESFTSELDLAFHCREVHFKQKLVFKDEGREEEITDVKQLFREKLENGYEAEHDYAKEHEENDANFGRNSAEVSENTESISNPVERKLIKSENDKTEIDLTGLEPVLFVRKVKDADKRYCPFCEKLFLSDKGLKDHIEMRCKRVPFRCFCGKGLREAMEPHTHFPSLRIPNYNRGHKSIECNRCKKKFNFRETYLNHTSLCSGEESKAEDRNDPKAEIQEDKGHTYECPTCLEVFEDAKALKKHKYTHQEEADRIICDICGKSFASKGGLSAHRVIHSDNREYICEHCGAGFNQKGNLMTHLKTGLALCKGMKGVHTLLVECSICKRSFTSLNRLRQHEKKHERINKLMSANELTCKVCDKLFRTFHEVKRHAMTHSGEKPFACTFCNKAFAQKSNLMAHMRIHTGYRPYECYICGQGFTQGTNLKQHVTKNHNIETYQFRRLPRGRKARDTNGAEKVVDVEMEYVEKAKRDGTYDPLYERKDSGRQRKYNKMTRYTKTTKKDMGTQATEIDDDDYDSDDDDFEPIEVDLSKKPRKTVSAKHDFVKEKAYTCTKAMPEQKIYLQVGNEQAETNKNVHVSVDARTIREMLSQTLMRSAKEMMSVSRPMETSGKLYNVTVPQNSNAISQVKYNTSLSSAKEKTVYTVLPQAEAEKVHAVPQTSFTSALPENRQIYSPTHNANEVHLVKTVVDSSGERMVVIEPQPSTHSNQVFVEAQPNIHSNQVFSNQSGVVVQHNPYSQNNQVYSNEADTAVSSLQLEQKFEMENKTLAAGETEFEATKYSPIIDTETPAAVSQLQNIQIQDSIENNPTKIETLYEVARENIQNKDVAFEVTPENSQRKVETYEVTDEQENRVEYVTVIFEDDGVETVEQEIGSTQTVVETQGLDLTATPVQELTYMENVARLDNMPEVSVSQVATTANNLITYMDPDRTVVHISQ